MNRLAQLAALALLAGASASGAATLRVPDDFPHIQAALDVAQSGDVVLVAPGTWTQTSTRTLSFEFPSETLTLEAVAFVPAGVSLVSEGGAAVTTIRITTPGPDTHAIVAARLDSPDPILIQGFRLERSQPGAPAILLRENAAGTGFGIDGCDFAPMQGVINEGAGIWAARAGLVTVSNCRFDDVDNPPDCGTFWCRGAIGYYEAWPRPQSLRVSDCEFVGCDGGGIRATALEIVVERCTFTDCTTTGRGGGIYAEALASLIEDCDFVRCTGTPVRLERDETVVRRCRFVEGSGQLAGAISSSAKRITVEDCRFEDCSGGYAGAVISSPSIHAPSRIVGNLFRGITSETFGALYLSGGVIGTVTSNTFVDCTATGPIGAACAYIHPSQHGITDLSQNIFAGSTGARPAVRVHDNWAETLENGCNLYWDNEGGHADGFVPGETAVFADPLFCDPFQGDYHLQWGSPALPANSGGCGLIGRFGFGGCNSIAVEPESWARIKARWR